MNVVCNMEPACNILGLHRNPLGTSELSAVCTMEPGLTQCNPAHPGNINPIKRLPHKYYSKGVFS